MARQFCLTGQSAPFNYTEQIALLSGDAMQGARSRNAKQFRHFAAVRRARHLQNARRPCPGKRALLPCAMVRTNTRHARYTPNRYGFSMNLRFAPRRALFVLLTVLLLATPAWTKGPTPFLDQDSVDLAVVLAPPPAAGSPAAQADIDVLVALQKARTPEQEAAALADRERSVFLFADVLGPQFNDKDLASIAPFFDRIHATEKLFVGKAKNHWKRPRPFLVDENLNPSLPRPQSYSYPSGHSAFGHLAAIVLANMVPEKAPDLFARGTRYARQRMMGGVHYPTDIEGGKIAAAVIANALFHDQEFMRGFAQAKAQIRTALKLR